MLRLAVVCAFVGLTSMADAAPLKVVNAEGQLTGLKGVTAGGLVYDVMFDDGSCVDVFSGCDGSEDFLFDTEEEARTLAEAVLDGVDDGPLGAFDSDPGLTFGCDRGATQCRVLFPFALNSSGLNVRAVPAANWPVEADDNTIGVQGPRTAIALSANGGDVYGVATQVGIVPAPAAGWLLLSGCVALAALRKRRAPAAFA